MEVKGQLADVCSVLPSCGQELNQAVKLDGRPRQLPSPLRGPQSTYDMCLFVAVTLSGSSLVAFVIDVLCNTILIKMLMCFCKSSKLHPRAKCGGVPVIPALWDKQVVL